MIHFNLTVIGQNAVENKLRTAAATGQKRMNNVTYQWAQNNVMPQLLTKAYPAERPGQKYVRTYNLRKGWGIRINNASINIHNTMGYSGYVVGDSRGGRQAWMHAGRWWLAREIVVAARPLLKQMIVKELDYMLEMGMGPR